METMSETSWWRDRQCLAHPWLLNSLSLVWCIAVGVLLRVVFDVIPSSEKSLKFAVLAVGAVVLGVAFARLARYSRWLEP